MPSAPCARGGHVYSGRPSNFYPALLCDGKRYQVKRNFCSDHAHEVMLDHKTDWHDRSVRNGQTPNGTCYGCGLVLESFSQLARFFLTAYIDGKFRRDFEAQYCPACTAKVVEEFEFDV